MWSKEDLENGVWLKEVQSANSQDPQRSIFVEYFNNSGQMHYGALLHLDAVMISQGRRINFEYSAGYNATGFVNSGSLALTFLDLPSLGVNFYRGTHDQQLRWRTIPSNSQNHLGESRFPDEPFLTRGLYFQVIHQSPLNPNLLFDIQRASSQVENQLSELLGPPSVPPIELPHTEVYFPIWIDLIGPDKGNPHELNPQVAENISFGLLPSS